MTLKAPIAEADAIIAQAVAIAAQRRADPFAQYPETPEALAAWIEEATGCHVPQRAVCPGHDAPFDMVAEFFFHRVSEALTLANRAGGKTFDVAALHLANNYHKPGFEVSHIGAIQAQAKRCYAYYGAGLRHPKLRASAPDPHITDTLWENGSRIEILPGTEAQTQGGHPNLATYDELEQGKRQPYENAKSMPVERTDERGRHRGQFLALSTRVTSLGLMQRALDEAEATGTQLYQWCCFETMEPCDGKDGRPECDGKECPLWQWCEGRVVNADGWRSRDEIIGMYRRVGIDTWEAQHLCLKPEAKALIYAPFSRANITEEADYVRGGGPLWLGYDWGFTDPTHIALLQHRDGAFHQFDELVGANRSEREWVRAVIARVVELDGYEGPTLEEWEEIWARRKPWPKPWPEVWPEAAGDPSAVQFRAELKEHGIGAAAPAKVKHGVEEGQDVLRAAILSGADLRRYYIHPRCLPGSQRVLASGTTAVFQRTYDGGLIVIRTASGNELSCTPNHPILTPHGWVAANLLREGSYVVSSDASQWVNRHNPDNYDVPASIEDIAEAFGSAEHMTPTEVSVAPEDFHGDGAGSKIAVVRANRLLGDSRDSAFTEQPSEYPFVGGDIELALLSSQRASTRRFETVGAAALGGMGGGHVLAPFVGREALHSECSNLALAPADDTSLIQSPHDDSVCYPALMGEIVHATASAVFADKITAVDYVSFSGHVYNLQTEIGAYVAEGIVTHNCKETIRSLGNYRARELSDGSFDPRPDPDPANHAFSHGCDALRYLMWRLRRVLGLGGKASDDEELS